MRDWLLDKPAVQYLILFVWVVVILAAGWWMVVALWAVFG